MIEQASTAELMEMVTKRSKKMHENKISYRSKIEEKIDTTFSVYDSLREDLRKDIKAPKSRDHKVLFSSLYDEPYDADLYNKQLKEWQAFAKQLHTLAVKLDATARKQAQSYLELTEKWI